MWPALDRPTLQGVRLVVPDLDAAAAFAQQVLGLERFVPNAAEAPGIACFRLGAQWLAFERPPVERAPHAWPGNRATLHWRCSDLPRQRALLVQSGFDPQSDSEPVDAAAVHVVAAETGACALEWVEGPDGRQGDLCSAPRITGLVMPTRTPERVAAHWARIFQLSVERHENGSPCLVLDGIGLQFVFGEEGTGGLRRITLALSDPAAVRARAAARGLTIDGDALTLAGLTIGLASA